jgi:hypothetical protein
MANGKPNEDAIHRASRMIRQGVERLGGKIMRHLMEEARSDAKPVSTFADRAPGGLAG